MIRVILKAFLLMTFILAFGLSRVSHAQQSTTALTGEWVGVTSPYPGSKRDEKQKNLDALLQLWKERYVSPTMIALIYSALGNSDKAFEWLDTADKAHDLNIVRIKEDFRFNSLRSDPRFTALVRRIGIP